MPASEAGKHARIAHVLHYTDVQSIAANVSAIGADACLAWCEVHLHFASNLKLEDSGL